MDNTPSEPRNGDYSDAIEKLNSTLKRAEALTSNDSVASSVGRYPPVPVELEADYDRGELLPSVEEVRMNNQMKVSLTRNMWSRESNKRQDLKSPAPTVYSRNNWRIAVIALIASLAGTIIGLVFGFQEGEDYEKLKNEANRGKVPSLRPSMPYELAPTYLIVDDSGPPIKTPIPDNPSTLNAPSLTPNTPSKRIKEVQQWLVYQQISSQEAFVDTESPQYKASRWIADEDEAQIPLPQIDDLYYNLSDQTSVHFIERYVLSLFWFGTKWREWNEPFEFCSKQTVCLWRRRILTQSQNNATNHKEKNLGVTCDNDGRIVAINMPSNNIQGSMISEVGHLLKLQHFALNHNSLTGEIPEEFSELTKLTYLALHYNDLQGTLSPSISKLTNLHVLGLSNNRFSGTIPAEWAELSDLITLGLDNNSLEGTLNIMEFLLKIKRIYLNSNSFKHNITETQWLLMQELQELDLSSNQLIGEIPDTLLDLPKLQVLSLGDNKIGGRLPTQYPSSSPLRYLTLSSNNFGGSIHTSIGKLVNLVHLDLSSNVITGNLPPQMSSLVNLEYLFLSHNEQFNAGGIPQFLGKLTKLEDLSLSLTNRVGQIPGSVLEKLSNLVLLDLGINDLDSEIPSELASLTRLKYLILNRNYNLKGTVPEEVQLLSALDILLVDRTSMSGSMGSLCNRQHKAVIVGSNCQISEPKMNCECCNICCGRDDDDTCQDSTFFGKLDPIWENSFQRKSYEFDAEILDYDDPSPGGNGTINLLGGSTWGDNKTLGIGGFDHANLVSLP